MKVICLDLDGVLNSAASFKLEDRKRKIQQGLGPVCETLSEVCCSNLQIILDQFPEVKIVISSTWRQLFSLEWLKKKLDSYGVDSSHVIDKTPSSFSGIRGREINQWLEYRPEVTHVVILDDCEIGDGFIDKHIVQTTWDDGLRLKHVFKAIQILKGPSNYPLKEEE